MDVASTTYAVVLVTRRRRGLLLLHRVPAKALGGDRWAAVGGRVEPGETGVGAARRELVEEIGAGCRVSLVRQRACLATYGLDRGRVHLFLGRFHGGQVRLNDEHLAWCWVSPRTYRRMASAGIGRHRLMRGVEIDRVFLSLWPEMRQQRPSRPQRASRVRRLRGSLIG